MLASERAQYAMGKIAGRLYDGWTTKERGRIKPRTSRKHLCAPRDADQNKSPLRIQDRPASCITFLSEQAFAPQNTRFWSRSRVWFQFTVG